ncbi:trypsin-like serine protease [Streptomyces sp. NPDC002602]|uniref:trypsin-like serine protease n=1 Tax=Streptomyces sp. NPDC002602 TaxID=3364654 RepID=UPI0036998C01
MRSLHSRGGPVRRPRGEPGRAAPRRGSLKVCGASAPGTDDSIARGDSGGPLVAGGKAIGIVSTPPATTTATTRTRSPCSPGSARTPPGSASPSDSASRHGGGGGAGTARHDTAGAAAGLRATT